MNSQRIKGNWKQFKGRMRERWGKLTHHELHILRGKRDKLMGKVQERYGLARDFFSKLHLR